MPGIFNNPDLSMLISLLISYVFIFTTILDMRTNTKPAFFSLNKPAKRVQTSVILWRNCLASGKLIRTVVALLFHFKYVCIFDKPAKLAHTAIVLLRKCLTLYFYCSCHHSFCLLNIVIYMLWNPSALSYVLYVSVYITVSLWNMVRCTVLSSLQWDCWRLINQPVFLAISQN